MAIDIDSSTPAAVAGSGPTVTTASFTPPAGSLLVVEWSGNSAEANPSTPTITDNLGTHLTYTLVDWRSYADLTPVRTPGQAAIWVAPVASSAAMTLSVTNNAGSDRHSALRVRVLTGADLTTPVGAHGKSGSTSTSSIAQQYAATRAGSMGFLVASDWFDTGTPSAGSGCTLEMGGRISGFISYGAARRTTGDGVVGANTTLNLTLGGTSGGVGWVYAEILPAPGAAAENAAAAATAPSATVDVGPATGTGEAGAVAYPASVVVEGGGGGGNASLFTTQTPSETDNNDSASIEVGTWIKSSVAGLVNGIRWYCPATAPSSAPIGLLYDDTGTELARATFGTLTTGDWNEVFFSSPVSIGADEFVLAAVWTPDRYVGTGGFFNTGGEGESGITNGVLSSPVTGGGPLGYTGNGLFVEPAGTEPVFPTSTFNGGCYFTDILFSTSSDVFASAGVATAAATAHDATVSTSGDFPVDEAAATATAEFDSGTTISLTLIGDNPVEAIAQAHDATVSTAAVPAAGIATATAAAFNATVDAPGAAAAGIGVAAATAYPATVTTTASPDTGAAAATATAHDATVSTISRSVTGQFIPFFI